MLALEQVNFDIERRATYSVRFIEGQSHCRTSWHTKMSLTFNQPISNILLSSNLHTSMHRQLTQDGRVVYAKQPTKRDFSIGCFAYNINNYIPLVMHARDR